jgi:hypothetical protein
MYEKEIELVDSVIEGGEVWSHKRAAWYTIREALKQQLKNKSSNSDYTKCKIEAEIKRLEDNPEGDYTTRISALEWALRIIAER